MEKRKIYGLFAAAVASMIMAGCVKESSFRHEPGSLIQFGASMSYDSGIGTRTEYSGDKVTVSSGDVFERIDWVKNYDQIRILCEAASDGPSADYAISGIPVARDEKSEAGISPLSGYGLHWGTGEHRFYALYPVPGMTSNYAFTDRTVSESKAKIEPLAGGKARITGEIPASQEAVRVGNEFKPNMNYAYMYAATKVADESTGRVTLSFRPLVTTFEVTLKATESLSGKMTKVELASEEATLSGSFTADLSVDTPSSPSIAISGALGNTVSIDLGSGIDLSAEPVKFTFLTLPVDQTSLTLKLYFGTDYSSWRFIDLKLDTGWMTVPGAQKVYISNLDVPELIYHLEVTGPAKSISWTGGTEPYVVKSYKDQSNGTKSDVGWNAEFWNETASRWESTAPSWLTAFTKTDDGSVTGESFDATVNENTETEPKTWKGSKSPLTDVDLSLRDIYGNSISRSTANCYVIKQPGTYKFPCVYGNALKNGAVNSVAYANDNTSEYALQHFVRHDGNPIVAPWIKDNGITIQSARLLWQDWDDLVTNVSFSDDYIHLEVTPENIWQGNALIAALDATGTIVWSWHIWVTDGGDIEASGLETTEVYSHPTVYTSVRNPQKVLNTNLGWCDAEELRKVREVKVRITQNESGNTGEFTITQLPTFVFGYSPFFQWGRKDMFLSFTEHPGEGTPEFYPDKQQYPDPETNPYAYKAVVAATGSPEDNSIARSIQHPNEAYYMGGASANNWCGPSTRYDNLWDAYGQVNTDHDGVKTVYDPCPVGFKIPNMYAFTGFFETGFTFDQNDRLTPEFSFPTDLVSGSMNILGGWRMGWVYKANPTDAQGVFFPSTGIRESSTGLCRDYLGAYYWLNVNKDFRLNLNGPEPFDDPNRLCPAYFEFREDLGVSYNDRGSANYGFSVRPVVE